jgi:light-regulated signal transduction histidine kinase (bacteriophytochrome)
VYKFLGEYHTRLIGEPLAKFTLAQPLHDLRNSLSRQKSASGISRAYRVRLTDSPNYLDIAFQQLDGRFLLEGVISAESFGASMGTISRLLEGIGSCDEAAIARRMRALCGYDRVLLASDNGEVRADCSRSSFPQRGSADLHDFPVIIVDTNAPPVPMYPRSPDAGAGRAALTRAPSAQQIEFLKELGVRSMLNVPIIQDEEVTGVFSCDSQSVVQPCFETHAAAELFAQVYAMQHEGPISRTFL